MSKQDIVKNEPVLEVGTLVGTYYFGEGILQS